MKLEGKVLEEKIRVLKETHNEWLMNDYFSENDTPNRFITLIGRNTHSAKTPMAGDKVSKNDLIDGYRKFYNILNRKLFGRHNKGRSIKHFPVLEQNVGGHHHIHTMMAFPTEYEFSVIAKNTFQPILWKGRNGWFSCEKLWSETIKVGADVSFHDGWNKEIYDADGCIGYLLKQVDDPEKCSVLWDLM